MKRILCAGTYEKTVYGIEFCFEKKAGEIAVQTAKTVFSDRLHTAAVSALATNPQHSLMATGSADETVNVYDLKKQTHLGTVSLYLGSVNRVMFSGMFLFVCTGDGSVAVVHTGTWETVHVIRAQKKNCLAFSIHPSGQLAFSLGGGERKNICLWDMASGKRLQKMRASADKGEALDIVWSDKGRRYAVLYEEAIEIYNVDSDEIEMTQNAVYRMKCVLFVGEERLVCSDEAGALTVVDIETQTHKEYSQCHEARIRTMHLEQIAEAAVLFTGSTDGIIRAWEMKSIAEDRPKLLYTHQIYGRVLSLG